MIGQCFFERRVGKFEVLDVPTPPLRPGFQVCNARLLRNLIDPEIKISLSRRVQSLRTSPRMSRHRDHFLRLLMREAALSTTLFAWFLQISSSCLFASDSTDPSSEYFAVTSFFREYDRNQDGELTQDELPGEAFDFDAIDRDGNGKVNGTRGSLLE